MQLQSDKSHRLDEIKTQFKAREGYYRLMNSPDYSQRSQRAMGFSTGTANSNSSTTNQEKTCIKISLVTINENEENQPNELSETTSNKQQMHRRSRGARDMKICFNVGRELFVYNYDGVRTGPDASNPIYKRFYKGSAPVCHDFNQTTASSGSICLLVGFAHGQVQLIDLNSSDEQELCKEFNSERFIDKTRVTCIKWLPNSSGLFLVAHASGQMYLYKDDLPCPPTPPIYQIYKQTEGLIVYTCKTKATRNPIHRWSVGANLSDGSSCSSSSAGSSCSLNKTNNEDCSLNEFIFSPCAKYIACVSQDGFLRVYCYDSMELVGRARSYYGGLTCVCWSPDGKYVVTGGEDDLITVWSFAQRRVVARGMGHKSWVSVVSFDPFYTGHDLKVSDADNYDDEDEEDPSVGDLEDEDVDDDDEETRAYRRLRTMGYDSKSPSSRNSHMFNSSACSNLSSQKSSKSTTYRFGSVGQDTQLCLWDLSDDLLQQPVAKLRVTSVPGASSLVNITANSSSCQIANSDTNPKAADEKVSNNTNAVGLSSKGSFAKTFSLVSRRDKRYLSSKFNDKNSTPKGPSDLVNGNGLVDDPTKLLGSRVCPRMNEVPLIEPTVCKKISYERFKLEDFADMATKHYDVHIQRITPAEDCKLLVVQCPALMCPLEKDPDDLSLSMMPKSMRLKLECTNGKNVYSTTKNGINDSQLFICKIVDDKLVCQPLSQIVTMRADFNHLNPKEEVNPNEEIRPVSVKFSASDRHHVQPKTSEIKSDPDEPIEEYQELTFRNLRGKSATTQRDLLFGKPTRIKHDPDAESVSIKQEVKLIPDIKPKIEKMDIDEIYSANTYVNIQNSVKKTDQMRKRIKECLIKAKLVSFEELYEFLCSLNESPLTQHIKTEQPNLNPKEIIDILNEYAVIVQGNWAMKSELLYGDSGERECTDVTGISMNLFTAARDYLLWLFDQNRFVSRPVYSKKVKIPDHDVIELFNQFAEYRPEKRKWELKLETDYRFIEKFPEVVDRQKAVWRVRRNNRLSIFQ